VQRIDTCSCSRSWYSFQSCDLPSDLVLYKFIDKTSFEAATLPRVFMGVVTVVALVIRAKVQGYLSALIRRRDMRRASEDLPHASMQLSG